MKRFNVMIALGHLGCALVLFSSRATVIAASTDDRGIAQSEERLKQEEASRKPKRRSKELVREQGKRDYRHSSRGERDALISTGVGVAISAFDALNKPKRTVYEGGPVSTQNLVKSKRRTAKRNRAETFSQTWSKIDPVKKDFDEVSEQPKPPLDGKTGGEE